MVCPFVAFSSSFLFARLFVRRSSSVVTVDDAPAVVLMVLRGFSERKGRRRSVHLVRFVSPGRIGYVACPQAKL